MEPLYYQIKVQLVHLMRTVQQAAIRGTLLDSRGTLFSYVWAIFLKIYSDFNVSYKCNISGGIVTRVKNG